MEDGESVIAAVEREALEEANAVCEDLRLYSLYSLTHVSQVYLIFRGKLKDGYASPGSESLEVRLYTEDEIPWQHIAFTVVYEILVQYFSERRNHKFNNHLGDILRDESDCEIRIRRYY
jgi:NADH pyrophosphatase NudC (nudix superfamily)